MYAIRSYYENGVLMDVNDDDSIIQHIDTNNYQDLINKNIIADGMLPKLTNCFNAIQRHVHKVCIGKPEMLV